MSWNGFSSPLVDPYALHLYHGSPLPGHYQTRTHSAAFYMDSDEEDERVLEINAEAESGLRGAKKSVKADKPIQHHEELDIKKKVSFSPSSGFAKAEGMKSEKKRVRKTASGTNLRAQVSRHSRWPSDPILTPPPEITSPSDSSYPNLPVCPISPVPQPRRKSNAIQETKDVSTASELDTLSQEPKSPRPLMRSISMKSFFARTAKNSPSVDLATESDAVVASTETIMNIGYSVMDFDTLTAVSEQPASLPTVAAPATATTPLKRSRWSLLSLTSGKQSEVKVSVRTLGSPTPAKETLALEIQTSSVAPEKPSKKRWSNLFKKNTSTPNVPPAAAQHVRSPVAEAVTELRGRRSVPSLTPSESSRSSSSTLINEEKEREGAAKVKDVDSGKSDAQGGRARSLNRSGKQKKVTVRRARSLIGERENVEVVEAEF
ncbi:hypothetical protein HDU97_008930 [Phlyctochytrium planicorne]|nr:hypothetical protein HDU97_008930 [Phlyctochytrium planicorne]